MNLSVVIPTYNRCQALALTLQHLSLQNYPFDDFEVCVVDDGSQDNTQQVLQDYADRLPLVALRQSQSGTSVARNQAILAACGRHILFMDDDVLVPPDFLRRHAYLLARHPGKLIRGPVINVEQPLLPPLPTPKLSWRHYSRNYLCTSNASLERRLLLSAGLFDPDFGRWEDAELGVRLKALRVARHFDSATFVYHWKPALTSAQRLEVAAKDGRAAAQLYRRYPSLKMWLRSGLGFYNRWRNRFLRLFPGPWRTALEIEAAYLDAGCRELRS